jgi:hypothetical protein
MCLRSFSEPEEYPKYPRLPVLHCKGFEKPLLHETAI